MDKENEMKKDDGIIGIVFAVVGLAFFTMALPFGVKGADGQLAAGFFPLLSSGALIIASVIVAVKGFRSQDRDGYWKLSEDQVENKRIFLLTIIGVVVFLLLWKIVAFSAAAYLLSLFLNWVYKRTWKFNLLFTVIFVTMLIICFEKIMLVQFGI